MPSLPSAFRLSFVIPTYNRRDLVLRAVSSVLDQDNADGIQVIVADDGSTDGTVETLAERFGTDARVRVVATRRAYTCAARNAGFAAAPVISSASWIPTTSGSRARSRRSHRYLQIIPNSHS